MKMEKFIKKHKKELQEYIKREGGYIYNVNTREIELWINNDESLYQWAKSENVKFED